MLGFGHQTVFGLCLALVVLAAVSLVCVALLFIERQDINLLQQHVTNLQQENAELKTRINDFSSGLVKQQEATLQQPD